MSARRRGLFDDDLEELLVHRVLELEVVARERQRRAVDRSERRAQLVRHGRDEVLANLLERALLGQVAERVHRSFVEADPRDREPALFAVELQWERRRRCRSRCAGAGTRLQGRSSRV